MLYIKQFYQLSVWLGMHTKSVVYLPVELTSSSSQGGEFVVALLMVDYSSTHPRGKMYIAG